MVDGNRVFPLSPCLVNAQERACLGRRVVPKGLLTVQEIKFLPVTREEVVMQNPIPADDVLHVFHAYETLYRRFATAVLNGSAMKDGELNWSWVADEIAWAMRIVDTNVSHLRSRVAQYGADCGVYWGMIAAAHQWIFGGVSLDPGYWGRYYDHNTYDQLIAGMDDLSKEEQGFILAALGHVFALMELTGDSLLHFYRPCVLSAGFYADTPRQFAVALGLAAGRGVDARDRSYRVLDLVRWKMLAFGAAETGSPDAPASVPYPELN